MTEFQTMGKYLIITGVVIVIIGAAILFADKFPWLGKLPGDITYKSKNVTIYFPIVTSVILSIIISVILYFFKK